MADEEAESIGGISVSISASHARLAGDLAAADRIIEAWAKDRFVTVRANVVMPAGVAAGAAQPRAAAGPPPVVFGARATTGIQAAQGQTAFQKAVNAELSKTGQTWNTVTGEIESATKATRTQKTAIVEVQQAAAQATPVNLDFASAQNDAQALLATMREVLATAERLATAPAPRVAAGSGGSGRRTRAGTAAEFPPLEEPRGDARGSATFAPAMTQARQAEIEAARLLAPRPRAFASSPRASSIREDARAENTLRRTVRAEQARDEEVFARSAPDQAIQRERQIEERVARARANITASGRTARTASSSIGALFGGTQGKLIEANAKLAASDKAVAEAEKAALPFRRRIAEYDLDIANSSGRVAVARSRAKDAFASDPKTVLALDRERKAIEGQRTALADINKLQSGGNVLRNLAAITAGGAAFGVGFAAVNLVVDQLAKGFDEFFEIQTGFGATSTRVTLGLGQQTLALHGNADAALAAAEAQAGISSASADALNAQLKLTTQIKAGAQAQQQASGLFRAGFGVGNAPSGLFGSYGGALGTGLFGQKGFTQQVQTDVSAFQQGRGGPDLLGSLSTGLDYLTNPGVRASISNLAVQQGNTGMAAVGGVMSFPAAFQKFLGGDLKGAVGAVAQGTGATTTPFQQTQLSKEGEAYLNNLNDAAKRGAQALGDHTSATYRVARSQTEVDQAIKAAAAAGDQFGVALAQQQGIVLAFGDAVAGATGDVDEYRRGTQQAAVGAGIADPALLAKANLAAEQQRQRESAASLDTIRSQQAFQLPSIIAAAQRQSQFALGTQQPAQFAMQALANPNAPVGTGIAPEDQARVAATLGEANALQDTLNTKYAEGQQIIQDTYRPAIVKNFGAAAGVAFDQALSAVAATGQQIAAISASISNKQAAYQVAQYNFQLQIAKRSLSDIGGLTGQNFGAGQSYLGVLERQNLQLSRQGQQLQFNMSQRQINFQTAVAGFQTPGVTPEERQANIKEAQIEAGFAQKQLDIQKQMFGNQVQIVDISNLRQGADLMRQISLLQQGRAITVDTAAAEQKIMRLNQLQQKNVAQVGTYLTAVDGLVSTAFGYISQLEAAAGKAMVGVATSVLGQFGIFINGLAGAMGGGRSSGNLSHGATGSGPGGAPSNVYASGTIQNIGSPTRIGENGLMGEAGDETLLILSQPRSGSGTAGGLVVVNFNGDIHTSSTGDLDKVTQAVLRAMGRGMSTAGLRTGN